MSIALDLKFHGDQLRGVKQPALHASRIEKMLFVRYTSPPKSLADRGEYDMWLESVNYLCNDLHWLLQQPHDKFWCQVVFDDTLHQAIDSFLRHCPRSHSDLKCLPDNGKHKHLELCRLVFMTLLRMSTHKESQDCFITPRVFGDILYENYLFDIPKILDICSLFGKCNGALLAKMIENIFTQQEKYLGDLRDTVPTIVQVFTNIASQCGVKLDDSNFLSPQKLEVKSTNGSKSAMSLEDLGDLVTYLDDIGTTLQRFLEIYPKGCQVFFEAQFCSILANFYEMVMPVLKDKIKQTEGAQEDKKAHLNMLRLSKRNMLSTFHHILNHVCLLPVLENGTDVALVSSRIEDFLHIMTSVLSEKRFLAAYEGMFVFQDDVDLLLQASSCVDASQFEYIQSAINSAFATFGRRKSPHGDTNTGGRTSPDGAPDLSVVGNNATSSPSSSQLTGGARPKTSSALAGVSTKKSTSESHALARRPDDVEIESLICAVKDILPHLGDGFIEFALEELGWDQERVVSCILEGSLPSTLSRLSLDMPRQQRQPNQGDGQMESLVDSRKNVFDNDEFDVFHRKTVNTENIHQGKKKLQIESKEKEVTSFISSRYGEYGTWERHELSELEEQENSNMYDDEYDDTYDTTNVGADDADSADELSNKTVPRVLADLERKKAKMEGKLLPESDDGSESDEQEEVNRFRRDQFVQDPAKLREQAAQRRASQATRGRRGGPPRSFDVKGAAKGQGQSKEVLHNRRTKEQFKGQRNKANADRKMSKGMF